MKGQKDVEMLFLGAKLKTEYGCHPIPEGSCSTNIDIQTSHVRELLLPPSQTSGLYTSESQVTLAIPFAKTFVYLTQGGIAADK
jgi:hypothetical protein